MSTPLVKGAAVQQLLGAFSRALPYSSIFGRAWYLTLGLRSIMLFTIGTGIYNNDDSSFKCATDQWMCGTICFNQFMPMNLTRFWTWQMVVLGFCAVLFVWFIDGPSKDLKIKSDLEKRCKAEDGFLAPHEKSKLEKLQKKYKNHSGWQIYRGRKEIMMSQNIKMYNIAHRIALFTVEVVFLLIFMYLLKRQYNPKTSFHELALSLKLWQTPPTYICELTPLTSIEVSGLDNGSPFSPFQRGSHACDQSDPLCTVSRFTEKTYITVFMFTVSCGAIICLLLDLLRIIFKSGRKKIPVGLKKMTSRKVEPAHPASPVPGSVILPAMSEISRVHRSSTDPNLCTYNP